MAETYFNEGLTRILNIFPRLTQAPDATLYLGLFTSQTASTVAAQTVTFGVAPGITECTSTGGYARTAITSALWGAPATSGGGVRSTTTAPIAFATSTGPYSGIVNGFFIATNATVGGSAGDIGIGMANFSDVTPVTVNAAGFTIRITPFFHWDA